MGNIEDGAYKVISFLLVAHNLMLPLIEASGDYCLL